MPSAATSTLATLPGPAPTRLRATQRLAETLTASGALRQRFDIADALPFPCPAVVDGASHIGSDDADLHAVAAATGQECWIVWLSGSSGRVAVGDQRAGGDALARPATR